MKEINVIKVGGGVLEDKASLRCVLDQCAALEGAWILVHGGGRLATQMAARLGMETKMVGGRRITDEEMLRVVTMVYGGLVNRQMVAELQARGVNAIGLTGADMNLIRSHRRPLKEMEMPDGTRQEVDFGWVGDVDRVDASALQSLLEAGALPVIAPLTHDAAGHLLNTNADTIASQVAQALTRYYRVTFTFCFEMPGLLHDVHDPSSLISSLPEKDFRPLVEQGIIADGMIPKLENAYEAIHQGVAQVVITRWDDLKGLHGTHLK